MKRFIGIGLLPLLLFYVTFISPTLLYADTPRNMPDPNLTPGDVLSVTRDDICVPGYTKKVRNVPLEVNHSGYRRYGILSHRPGEYEMDHLVPLEVGGSNSIKNLWPEPASGIWNYHVKDALENNLHKLVCEGKVELATAQKEIATDWISAYKKYFQTESPVHLQHDANNTPSKLESSTGGDDKVWVNTRSGVIWKPGGKYYGKTKEGEYMTIQEALKRGYHEAGK